MKFGIADHSVDVIYVSKEGGNAHTGLCVGCDAIEGGRYLTV
jgi:hypothetical protein